MVWTAWLLLACRAEYLGIVIPPKGTKGLSIEDLQRDVWLGQRNPHERSWYHRRMLQMDLDISKYPDHICFGPKDAARISVHYQKRMVDDVAIAAQISLAKVAHGNRKDVSFCVYESIIETSDWILGDLRGEDLAIQQNVITSKTTGNEKEDFIDLNYAQILDHITVISELLSLD